jgi:hypothetical protein
MPSCGRATRRSHDDDRDEGVELAAAAERLADHRPAAAAADRERLGEPGRHVRRAEREQFLVGVDAVAVADGEGPCGQDVVGVRDDRDAHGGQQQCGEIGRGHVGNARSRQPRRHVAYYPDAVCLQVEDGGDKRGEHHDDERHRRAREAVRSGEQQHEHRGRQQHGGTVQLVQSAQERRQLGYDGVALDRNAGRPAELAGDHQHPDAGQVADQHRLGQQVGDETQPE